MILYSAANTFRAWIAYEEKKISKPFRLFCQFCYVNLAIAGLLFSLCFAVQPHDHESLIVHTGPFAYFTIALVMNQVSKFNNKFDFAKHSTISGEAAYFRILGLRISILDSDQDLLHKYFYLLDCCRFVWQRSVLEKRKWFLHDASMVSYNLLHSCGSSSHCHINQMSRSGITFNYACTILSIG